MTFLVQSLALLTEILVSCVLRIALMLLVKLSVAIE